MNIRSFLIMLLSAVAILPAWASRWNFDTANTSIRFAVAGVGGAIGHFSNFSGVALYHPGQLSRLRVNLQLDAQSLDAGIKTAMYKGNDALAVDKYPELSFVSTQVIPQGDYAAVVRGTLTMRGVSRPVEWQMNIDPEKTTDQTIYFKANTSIRRSLWNMNNYSTLASDIIDLSIKGRLLAEES